MPWDDLQKVFYQIEPRAFQPFNDAPAYLTGQVLTTDSDGVRLRGTATRQSIAWFSIGAKSEVLEPESFEFSVDARPKTMLGSYSIGVMAAERGLSLNVSHFLRSSISIPEPEFVENVFSSWGYDSTGQRSQSGAANRTPPVDTIHRFQIRYDAGREHLSARANGQHIHSVFGSLDRFRLLLRFQAVAVQGDFDLEFFNLSYFTPNNSGMSNIQALHGWNPQYASVFISYSRRDATTVKGIVNALRKYAVRVSGDWDFNVGDSLLHRISEDVKRSGYLIVFLSPFSAASEWVQRELRLALEDEAISGRVKVLPVVIQDCEIPEFLGDKLWADLRTDLDEGLRNILAVIRGSRSW